MNRYEPKMRELNAEVVGFLAGRLPFHVTEEQLQKAERRLGVRLPEDYREFIQDFGAFGVPAVDFPLKSNQNNASYSSGSLEVFYGIIAAGEPNAGLDIVSYYSEIGGLGENWSPDWLRIGHDAGGSPLILDIKGETVGSIYVLEDHMPILVADSFNEFMQLLTIDSEHDEAEAAEDAAIFWATYSTPFPP